MRRFTTVLTVLLGLFPLTFGARFLIDPHGAALGFGVDPAGTATAYLAVKGIRDIVTGLNLLALFAMGQRRATGLLMAIAALIPIVDMTVVLTHDGSAATAFGVHGLTALVVLFDAVLLLRERRTAEVPQPAHS
ncbi:DUF4267 domain-containing protein [Kribbella sp. NPDC026611]|uniref:DUF4267 domain-containing protein n=1 Tax=Kribbella sp. NPDC026611 TaxID=3154911 RepID=UPI0033E46F59